LPWFGLLPVEQGASALIPSFLLWRMAVESIVEAMAFIVEIDTHLPF
jgi:hypothetical protein